MTSFRKYIYSLLAIVLVIGILPTSISAYEKYNDEKEVKIGLKFKESAVPSVSLSSNAGIEIGENIEGQFNSIMRFTSKGKLIIRKDDCFSNNTDSLSEGAIHIQIGDEFNTKDEANVFLENIPKLKSNPYVVYENGWSVWVGLYESVFEAESEINSMKSILSTYELKIIYKDDKRIQVVDETGKVSFIYNTKDKVYEYKGISRNDNDGIISVDGKKYRGKIIAKRFTDSDLTIINKLKLQEYLYGVLPREISGNWPIEAQKAQAVAARNYAMVSIGNHDEHGFDLCGTTHCQVYGGYDSENPRSIQAVDETNGKVLTCNGKIVTTFYHSNSGGYTENAENVWSSPLDYIKGVEDPYSIGAPNDRWEKVYSRQEIEGILASKELYVGSLENLIIKERSQSGRVLKMEIVGTSGSEILEKNKIRSIFGYNNIKSTLFDINGGNDTMQNILGDIDQPYTKNNIANGYVINDEEVKKINNTEKQYIYDGTNYTNTNVGNSSSNYTFVGKGWGHGLGMSQWGAKKMAEEGFTYEEILKHYYTDTIIE
ncbi:SpoIID/LytB domain-containing protein [Lutibacter sp. B2]|nr:SpoIID/LytB domain-containing protein [Lutibacter sp. B2]